MVICHNEIKSEGYIDIGIPNDVSVRVKVGC